MATEVFPNGYVYDSETGRVVGVVDKLGREQLVPSFFTAFTSAERTSILQRGPWDPLRAALLGLVEASTVSTTPAPGYVLALRSHQAGWGNPIDFSPAGNALALNLSLFPPKWTANTVVPVNTRCTPNAMNGKLYRCKTGGGANGTVEPVWPTTIGAEVVSGANTYVCEKGPWVVDAVGAKLFRTLSDTQLGASGALTLPGALLNWDFSQESLIINWRIKFDYAASGQAAVRPILSTRNVNGGNKGFRALATGGGFNDLRFQFRDGAGTSILTDDTSTTFNRKPLDGFERSFTVMIDSLAKMMWTFSETSPITPAEMYNGGSVCPNDLSLSALLSDMGADDLVIGGDPGSTASTECAFKSIDVIKVRGGLPGNLQAIPNFFARGGLMLLPHSVVA